MRDAARLMLKVEELSGQKMTMLEALRPSMFDFIVDAALEQSMLKMDDVDDLASPSFAIKIKYSLQKIAHYKKLSAIRRLDQSREDLISREEKDQAEEFMYILGAEWTTKVQTKAMKVLKERKEFKKTKLPSCQDMKTLAEHTTEALRKADLKDKSYM